MVQLAETLVEEKTAADAYKLLKGEWEQLEEKLIQAPKTNVLDTVLIALSMSTYAEEDKSKFGKTFVSFPMTHLDTLKLRAFAALFAHFG